MAESIDERVLRYARIAIEDEFGSKVDVTANEDQFIDIDIASLDLDAPDDPVLRYEGGLSRSVHTHRPGPYIPDGSIEYAFDIHTVAHLLYLALGQVEQTQVGDMTVEEVGAESATLEYDINEENISELSETDSFDLEIDSDGTPETVSFDGTESVIGDVVTVIDTVTGCSAVEDNGSIIITSDTEGSDSSLDVTNVDPNVEDIGITADTATGEDGDYIVEGDTEDNLFLHEFTPTRHSLTLPSATVLAGKDHFQQDFQGCTVNSLSFELDDDFAFVTADIIAQQDSRSDIEAIEDLTITKAYPVTFYETKVKIGIVGETQEEMFNIENLSLEINNNLDADAGIVLGSRFPQRIVAGDFEVSGSMDIAFDGPEQLQHFWGADDAPDDDSQDIMNINYIFQSAPYMADVEDGGETVEAEIRGSQLDLHVPNVLYETVNIQPSGRDRLVQTVDFRGYYDETTQYEVIAELKNDIDYITDYTGFEDIATE